MFLILLSSISEEGMGLGRPGPVVKNGLKPRFSVYHDTALMLAVCLEQNPNFFQRKSGR